MLPIPQKPRQQIQRFIHYKVDILPTRMCNKWIFLTLNSFIKIINFNFQLGNFNTTECQCFIYETTSIRLYSIFAFSFLSFVYLKLHFNCTAPNGHFIDNKVFIV